MPARLNFTRSIVFVAVIAAAIVVAADNAFACGGFFCRNVPVDQVGERIVFTDNDDGTITSLIEILYQGAAEDFSWILPIPEAIEAGALTVPEDGTEIFDELHDLTDVQILAPPQPDCAEVMRLSTSLGTETSRAAKVDVFSSGEVGPFGFDVVGATDKGALVTWLRDNNYQVTNDMIPLIDVYVEQEMAFIAMRLLDGETSDSITPIEITYPAERPMIPLRLTAVAAQPNMPVWVWFFGDAPAGPVNYARMEVATEEIRFFPFGNDYTFLVQQRANAFDGHAFITEFAQPTASIEFEQEWLRQRGATSSHLTRLATYIDPAEMTLDPIFEFDANLPTVSHIRDASELRGLYNCERNGPVTTGQLSHAIEPMGPNGVVLATTPVIAPSPQTTSSADALVEQNLTGTEVALPRPSFDGASGARTSSSFASLNVALITIALAAAGGLGIFVANRRTVSSRQVDR